VFKWDLGDGRDKEGAFIEPVYNSAGTYIVELTVSRATSLRGLFQTQDPNSDSFRRQITVKEPPPEPEPEPVRRADLRVSKTDDPDPYNPFAAVRTLTYTILVENLGPARATGVRLVDDFPSQMRVVDDGGCSLTGPYQLTCNLGTISRGGSRTVRIVIEPEVEAELPSTLANTARVSANQSDPNPENNSATETTTLSFPVLRTAPRVLAVSFNSFLDVAPLDGAVKGQVLLNGAQVNATNNASPFPHRLKGKAGRNTIEARLTSAMEGKGFWRFDFAAAEFLVAGSIQAEVGQVMTRDAHSIVFHLSGTPNERIRFSFELEP
jgi:hypothetical protein